MMAGPPQSHDPYLSQQVPPNQTYPNQPSTNYLHKKSENSTTDSSILDNQDSTKGNKLLINQLRSSSSNTSMLSTSTPISILTSSTTPTANSTLTPSSIPTTNFPPNSVEATTIPSKIKRKKLTAKDVSMYHSSLSQLFPKTNFLLAPVDPWKLMMSLRGGLLAETTWALDTINIMLADDQTHTYFRLKQMPGLLQAIVDIYIKCLTQLFDEFQNSPSNIENQQPSLNDLNGSSHLTCTTIKKHEYRQQQQQPAESIMYRVESNSLNKYKRKYTKEQSIIYDHVYDEQGNEKNDPTNILDLQNTDDLCYISTHFDPLRLDDNFYEKLYYGHQIDDTINDQSNKRLKTSENDTSIDDTDDSKSRHCCNSDYLIEISDSNKEFLQRYKRKFEYDENETYELYPGICSSSTLNNKKDFDSCSNSNDQQENASSLFIYHSLAYDQISSRCTCVSSILRNLSFILGNDMELVKSKTLIALLARLLLLRHGVKSDNQLSLNETVNQDQLKVRKKHFFFRNNFKTSFFLE
jgi:AT-rich interactive domain-containing protein 1